MLALIDARRGRVARVDFIRAAIERALKQRAKTHRGAGRAKKD